MKSELRERILDSVLRVLGSEGIAAVSNRRIAAAADVSLGSITYHFPNQADMIHSALSRLVTEETARLRELAENYRGTGLSLADAAGIAEQVTRDLSFSAERIAPFEMYLAAGRDHALRHGATECFAAYDDLTVTILSALGVPDPEALAPTLVGLITGLQLRRLATGVDDQHIGPAILAVVRAASL